MRRRALITAQTRSACELDQRAERGFITAHSGVPLLIEALRTSGATVLDESVVIKRRKRGLLASQLVGGVFSLWAAGGERCEDLAQLREDTALALLLGHGLPVPQTARDFPEAFDEAVPPLWQGASCQGRGGCARPAAARRTGVGGTHQVGGEDVQPDPGAEDDGGEQGDGVDQHRRVRRRRQVSTRMSSRS